MKRLIIFYLYLVAAGSLPAAENPAYPCYRLSKPPALDGRIEPEVWAGVPEAGGTYFLKPEAGPAERPTWFRAGWTTDAVWLAIRCKEPTPEKIRTLAAESGAVWEDDAIEMCFQPPLGKLQYLANAAGTRWQARWLDVHAGKPMGAWQARAAKGKDEWTLEIMIPFADFNRPPTDQEQWPFVLARHIPGPAANRPVPGTGAHFVGDLDRLVFRAQTLKPEEAAGIARELAARKMPADMTFAAAMRAGMDCHAVQGISETEKVHPYVSSKIPVDLCGARKYYEAAAALADSESGQAEALLRIGDCLFAIGGRLLGEHGSLPNRAYARAVYERVVNMPVRQGSLLRPDRDYGGQAGQADARPETRVQAQLQAAYCLYNVGEFEDGPAIKAACEKLLALPAAADAARFEALRMLGETDIVLRNFLAAKTWCAKILELKGIDPDSRWRAELRWQILDNWERMTKTPRETFNRSYPHEALSPADPPVLPSIRWAKPGPGEPLRALVMCDLDGIREVGELAQRVGIEPVIVTTADREHFGEKGPDSYAGGAVGFAVAAAKKVQDAFTSALDQPANVMILAGVNWSGMPLPVREKILKKVAEGTPLILKVSQPDARLKAATANRAPAGLACVYPYRGLPAFAGHANREAWLEATVSRYRHGKGDIWMLQGYETPDYQILTPDPLRTDGEVKLVEYDYYLALIVHLIREAGGIKPPVRVKGKDHWDLVRESMQPLVFQLASEAGRKVTCVWTVRDRENRIQSAKQETVTLKTGDNDLRLDLGKLPALGRDASPRRPRTAGTAVPANGSDGESGDPGAHELSGGEYFVDLQVKEGETVLDFGSAYVRVKSADRIESVEVAKAIRKRDKVRGKVKVVTDGKRPNLTVRIQRRDNYRRVVGEQEVVLRGETARFALPAAEPLTAIQALDVELKQGGEVIDRRRVSFRIEDLEEADRHAVWPKEDGAGSYLAEYLRAGYERAGAGRVMNNMVTELLNVTSFSGQGVETFGFENPRAGWIYMMAEVKSPGPDNQVSIRVGTGEDSPAMLEWGGDEPAVQPREAMRYMEAGEYRVHVKTPGKTRLSRLIVRAIPEIAYNPYPMGSSTATTRARIDWDFLCKHVLKSANVVQSPCIGRGEEALPPAKEAIAWKQRGGKWIAEATVPSWPPSSPIPTVDEVFQYWTSTELRMGYVDGLACDELTIAHLPIQQQKFEVYCQALRQIGKDPMYQGKMVCPYIGLGNARNFRSVIRQTSEIGTKILLERYLYEGGTREEAARLIAQFYDLDLEPFLEVLAEPQRHFLHYYTPGMVPGGFCADVRPGANFKVFLDMQFNYLANAPACAGLYGVGPWSCCYADEETIRWLGRLYRHYCIEGRRDLLSTDPYELRHIQNGDFAEGLKGWKHTPAEKESIKAFVLPDLARLEGRSYLGELPGADDCVWMKRSAKGPNVLMQTVANLEKGRLYSAACCTYNPRKDDPDKRHAVALKIEPAEILRPLVFQAVVGDLNWHFVVFCATANSAELSISDWKSATEAGGKPGQELLYDFVQVQPYLAE